MQLEQYKNKILISFLVAAVFFALQLISAGNIIINDKDSLGIWPFILFAIAVIAFGYNINIVLKATNKERIKSIIDEEVLKERVNIIKEFEKEEQTEEQTNDKKVISEKIKVITPKGTFKNTEALCTKILKNLANNLNLVQGIFYIREEKKKEYAFIVGYALTNEEPIKSFKKGENLPGQVVETREISYISDIPENYFEILSGLGKSKPKELIFVPIVHDSNVLGVMELATFSNFNENDKNILEGALKNISVKLSQTIKS